MSVYEARYRKIEESVKPPSSYSAAKSMTIFEVRRNLSGTWPKVPLILGGFLVFGFLVALTNVLTITDPQEFWIGGSSEVGSDQQGRDGPPTSIKASISALLTILEGPGAIILIHIAIISSGLIAGDLKDRAIDLWFSKISLRAYFISKIIASIVLTAVGLPVYTLIYMVVVIYKRWPEFSEWGYIWEITWQMTLVMVVTVVFLSILILVFSAYTTNAINAGVIFIVFTFVTRVIFEELLFEATNIDLFYVLSPLTALNEFRLGIFAPTVSSEIIYWLSVTSIIGYMVASLILVYLKLKRERDQ